jgi:hypothetical protein
MPRVTKTQMQSHLKLFANDAMKIIKENINVNDLQHREDKPIIEENGWYYYLHKSIANVKPEIRMRRRNYNNVNEKPKGNRIDEEAWIYKEGMNCRILGIDENKQLILDKDHGFIIDGFSVQGYKRSVI